MEVRVLPVLQWARLVESLKHLRVTRPVKNLVHSQEYINDNSLMKPFIAAKDPELEEDDKRFICGITKIDPRDRPTATELLQDKWLQQ